MDALPQQLDHGMFDLAGLPPIMQTSGHCLDQSIAPVGGLQQHRAAIAGTLPLVKRQHHGLLLQIGKQQTLCRGRIGQAKAFLGPINAV